MIWHVHGTDASTGRDVVIAIDETDATRAIKAAIDRQIVVSHVAGEAGTRWRKAIVPLMLIACTALGIGCAVIGFQNVSLRGSVEQALTEQARMAQSLAG